MISQQAKQIRINSGHTQQSIAAKMKLSVSYIQKMENGVLPLSSQYIKMLTKLSKAKLAVDTERSIS